MTPFAETTYEEGVKQINVAGRAVVQIWTQSTSGNVGDRRVSRANKNKGGLGIRP